MTEAFVLDETMKELLDIINTTLDDFVNEEVIVEYFSVEPGIKDEYKYIKATWTFIDKPNQIANSGTILQALLENSRPSHVSFRESSSPYDSLTHSMTFYFKI
jgi:hypothetical protein